MRFSSTQYLAGLIALCATAAHGHAVTKKAASPYRPGISQAGNAVVIQQSDRLVIVQGGKDAVASVRTLDNERVGAGRAIPVEVTMRADTDGNGAVIRVEDRKIVCDGDASIEFIPRLDASHSAAGAGIPDDTVALNAVAERDGNIN